MCFSTFENVRIVENFLSKKWRKCRKIGIQIKTPTSFPQFVDFDAAKGGKTQILSFSVVCRFLPRFCHFILVLAFTLSAPFFSAFCFVKFTTMFVFGVDYLCFRVFLRFFKLVFVPFVVILPILPSDLPRHSLFWVRFEPF